ncbi:RHS repeat-associated core domain-containing protein, partial [Iodobacter sp. CM08]|uniref:RHS repeat-associated core domain-containing protein n=1 Tax=Iodobacter sp. CM08 TaxID=3085902 RepID=UPI002981446B
DEESGLHYNRHRYYDPEIGRFISSDPIGLMGGFNTHAYAPNSTEWVDPLGLWKGQSRGPNGQFGQGENPNKPKKQNSVCSTHNNNLDSKTPAIGYTLRDKDTNEILKYGETTQGKSRYSQSYLDSVNADFREETFGTKREMHCWQHQKIMEYKAKHGGVRPLLNKNDY